MFYYFIKHEFKSLLKTQRVIWALSVFSILFFLIFFLRIDALEKKISQYNMNIEVTEKSLDNASNYSFLNPRAILRPKPFSVYNEGYDSNHGDVIDTKYFQPILNSEVLNTERNDFYSDAIKMDISFLVSFFLSLFIFLISYDSINGEKETGTLRIIMTWNFKKVLFLYKKILGIFCFVFVVFSLPYLISGLYMIIKFGNFITLSFYFSYLIYWLAVSLFIAVISIAGVFTSLLSYKSNKSLVYALVFWLFLTIILPVTWDYFISENLYKHQLNQHTNNSRELDNELREILINIPDEANPDKVGHANWNGGYHFDVSVLGHRWTNEVHRNYMRYIHEVYYPTVKKLEFENLQSILISIQREKIKRLIMFFNPVIVFQNLVNASSGNSLMDYYQFLIDGIDIRDALIEQGVRDNWLFSNHFFASYHPDYEIPFWPDYIKALNREPTEKDGVEFSKLTRQMLNNPPKNEFKRPDIKRYNQREIVLSELSKMIFQPVLFLVLTIIILNFANYKLFNKYDVR